MYRSNAVISRVGGNVDPTLRGGFGLNLSAFEAPCQLLSFAALRRKSLSSRFAGLTCRVVGVLLYSKAL
jgi:hypothetical protein